MQISPNTILAVTSVDGSAIDEGMIEAASTVLLPSSEGEVATEQQMENVLAEDASPTAAAIEGQTAQLVTIPDDIHITRECPRHHCQTLYCCSV